MSMTVTPKPTRHIGTAVARRILSSEESRPPPPDSGHHLTGGSVEIKSLGFFFFFSPFFFFVKQKKSKVALPTIKLLQFYAESGGATLRESGFISMEI